MQILLVVLIAILILLVAIVLVVILMKKNQENKSEISSKDFYENIQNIIGSINELSKESNEKIADVKTKVAEAFSSNSKDNSENISKLRESVKEWIDKQSQSTQDKLNRSSDVLKQMLNDLNVSTQPLKKVEATVGRLDNLLSQNNKAGKAGEYVLSRLLTNWGGINKNNNLIYEEQYTMLKKDDGKSLRPDAFIKGDGYKFVNIPIDSKLPFNNYEKLIGDENNDSQNYKSTFNSFKNDVKERISETSKYVSDEDKTVYAIMFVPSETIYNFIVSEQDLIDFAFKKRVIIAGPSTLMSILQSVDQYMSLFDSIQQYDKKIDVLDKTIKFIDNYDQSLVKMLEGIDKLTSLKEDLIKKEISLKKQYERLLKENN